MFRRRRRPKVRGTLTEQPIGFSTDGRNTAAVASQVQNDFTYEQISFRGNGSKSRVLVRPQLDSKSLKLTATKQGRPLERATAGNKMR
jgi:hypothetical protein